MHNRLWVIERSERLSLKTQLAGKHRQFLRAYLANGRSGAVAYRLAYRPDASNQRAAEEASMLLRHPTIAASIGEADRRATLRA